VPDTAPRDSAPPALPPRRRLAAVLTVALPALTFLVGLLIGFGVWGAADEDAGRPAAAPPATVTGGPGAGAGDPDRTVTTTVPDECLAAIDEAERSRTLLEQAVAAVGDLDVSRLRQLVDDVRTTSTEIRELGAECRAQVEVSVGTTDTAPPS
jgi:hypothetical protein